MANDPEIDTITSAAILWPFQSASHPPSWALLIPPERPRPFARETKIIKKEKSSTMFNELEAFGRMHAGTVELR